MKIDRFITDIHKWQRIQSVLRAIESLSTSLGMTVIADGIESYEEHAYLQAATNIRYAEDYYFSKSLLLELGLRLSKPSTQPGSLKISALPATLGGE